MRQTKTNMCTKVEYVSPEVEEIIIMCVSSMLESNPTSGNEGVGEGGDNHGWGDDPSNP